MPVLVSIIHHSTYGGPHNQLLRLNRPFLLQGWKTVVVLPEGPGNAADRFRGAGIKVIQVQLHRPRKSFRPEPHLDLLMGFFPEISELRRIIRTERADVVQVFGPMYPHGAIAARLERVPVVWQLLGTFAPGLIRTLMMPAITYLSDIVMTTGIGVAQAHPGATKLGNRLITFFPPVDTNEFRPDVVRRKTAREKLRIPSESFLVGTVGNFNPVKGHDILVRAASQVQQSISGVYFRVLGADSPAHAGYYETNVKTLAADLGLRDNDQLDFFDPGSHVAHYLPAFDLFVLSSRSEGIPTSLLEAMACGLPVIAPDVGSINEVVEDGVTGRVVRPNASRELAEAIVNLFQNPDMRSSMGAAARRKAFESYETNVCVETHLRAYKMARESQRHTYMGAFAGKNWLHSQSDCKSLGRRGAEGPSSERKSTLKQELF